MKINKTKKNNISLIIKNIFIILIIFLSLVGNVSATTDTVFYFSIPLKDGTTYTSPYSDSHNVSKNKDAFKDCNVAKNLLTNSEVYGGTEAEKQIELKKECFYKIIDSETGKEYVNPIDFTPKTDEPPSPDVYKLLAPIGKLTQAPTDIGSYFNTIFNIALGLCAVLAVIMIVIGGVQYMGDESIFGKTEAKDRITKAIFGLLIALGSYALLNTINPDLLGGRGVTIKSVSAEIAGDTDAPIGGINSLPSGIICSGGKTNIPVIVNSFSGKMTYQMGAKGVAGPNNTIKLDCSGFVNYVLKCAGVPFVNGGTASIFSGAEKVTSTNGTLVNKKELALGDLVGWRAGENKEKYGHVMIYVGNGNVQVADSHGGSTVGKALGVFSISKYKDRIKYIKRAS